MGKIIIEARINEYSMRDRNPNVPWTSDEIVETAIRVRKAGASILHFHARHSDGTPNHDVTTYMDIIRRVRKETDLLILPTLGFFSNDTLGKNRMENIMALAKDEETKPDIIPLDMGTLNLEKYNADTGWFENMENIYLNTTDYLEHAAKVAKKLGIKVKMTCWDVGFIRRGNIFINYGLITRPGYFLFHLTDGITITGHPCTEYGVDALYNTLPNEPCYWTTCCSGGNLLRVAPYVIKKGGNLAIGLGDYHYSELGPITNEDLINRVVDLALAENREPATPEEARSMLC